MISFFDFHHHNPTFKNGIYNLPLFSKPVDFPFSAGIHPQDIKENNDAAFSWLKNISTQNNCIAIGECGLDGIVPVDLRLQEEVFKKQIEIANHLNKPLIIHCVRKHYELIPFKKVAKTPMIIHGFNKKIDVAEALLKEDFYLSFGKALLQNVSLQELVKSIDSRKYFLETDAADFEIENLYRKVAEIREESLEEIINQINRNLDFLKNG